MYPSNGRMAPETEPGYFCLMRNGSGTDCSHARTEFPMMSPDAGEIIIIRNENDEDRTHGRQAQIMAGQI